MCDVHGRTLDMVIGPVLLCCQVKLIFLVYLDRPQVRIGMDRFYPDLQNIWSLIFFYK